MYTVQWQSWPCEHCLTLLPDNINWNLVLSQPSMCLLFTVYGSEAPGVFTLIHSYRSYEFNSCVFVSNLVMRSQEGMSVNFRPALMTLQRFIVFSERFYGRTSSHQMCLRRFAYLGQCPVTGLIWVHALPSHKGSPLPGEKLGSECQSGEHGATQ